MQHNEDTTNLLDSYEQWHAARIGRETRNENRILSEGLERLSGVYGQQYLSDAERFFRPAFLGLPIPSMDGPMP